MFILIFWKKLLAGKNLSEREYVLTIKNTPLQLSAKPLLGLLQLNDFFGDQFPILEM